MSKIDDKHKALINYHVGKYSGSDVPEAVLKSKAKLIYSDSVKSYDPSKGEFDTYLSKNLMGLNRFVGNSMQIRMPEHKQQKVRMVMDAITEQYGEDENVDFSHMSKILHMKPKSIKSIYAGATRGIVSDPSVEDYVSVDPGVTSGYDSSQVYNALPSQLHKDIFDYTMGEHGKIAIKTNREVASRLGISESYVRKIKEDILSRVKGS